MEAFQSETVFDSLNLNPQLFMNEVLNAVDDTVDGAFEFYKQQALTIMGDLDTDGSDELIKSISSICNTIQEGLDKRMIMWEKYSLQHCFVVPQGVSLLNDGTSGDSVMDQYAHSDAEMDKQLDSLREKLYVVEKESEELQRELNVLRQQSTLSNSCLKSVTEALQACEQKSVHDMFLEMVSTAAQFRAKMEKTKLKRMLEFDHLGLQAIYNSNKDQSFSQHSKGLSAVELNDLQDFVADLKNL